MHIMSDNSGYYVTGYDSSDRVNICRYLFSTSSRDCQYIPSMYQRCLAQLKLSDSSFFLIGFDNIDADLHFLRITFSMTTPDWAFKMLCPSSACTAYYSESLLSSSAIYTIFTFGAPKSLYFTSFSLSGSHLSSTYKSNTGCTNGAYGATLKGNYIVAAVYCSTGYLFVYNLETKLITVKLYSNGFTLGVETESTGRFIIVGNYGTNGYITKFTMGSLNTHPDFSTTSFTMNILTSSTEDIIADSSQSISSLIPLSVSSTSYLNQTVTYSIISSYTSDVNYQTNDQSYSVVENTIVTKTPELPCSLSGSTSITFGIGNYIGTAPSWVSINSTTGSITITAPEVSSDTEYYFYINSVISSSSGSAQKIIKLTILNCTPSNCQKCLSTNSSACEVCNSGYDLNSGACTAQDSPTEAAQALSTATTSAVAATIGCAVLVSFANTSSIATLWMTINQLQIFFLLLLTRAWIPEDIKAVIKGSDFSSNIYDYIPFRKLDIYPPFLHDFEFELTNAALSSLGIKYNSTIANTYSILFFFLVAIIFYIWISLLRFVFSKCTNLENHSCSIRTIIFIIKKVFLFMTFGFFIRNALEMSQFILISSINEIYQHETVTLLRIVSFIYAILMLLLFVITLFSIVYLSFSSYRLKEKEHNKLGELFRGLKNTKKSKSYVSFLLLRRLLYVLLLITLVSIASRPLIGIISFFQILYLCLIIFLRPYEEIKCNIIEIMNEIYFTFLITALLMFNSKTDWSTTTTNIYLWVMTSNTMTVFLIVFVDTIRLIIKCIRNRCQRETINNCDTVQVMPKSVNRPPSASAQPTSDSVLISPSIVGSHNPNEESKCALPMNNCDSLVSIN